MGSERWEAVKRVGGLEAVNSGVEGYFRVVEAALGVGRGEGRATLGTCCFDGGWMGKMGADGV